MILVLEQGSGDAQVEDVLRELEELGLEGRVLSPLDTPLVHVVAGRSRQARILREHPAVIGLVPTPGPRIRSRGRHFFPYHAINWISASLVVFGLLVALAGFFPPGVGANVDPFAEVRPVPLPWFLRAPHAFLGHGWIGALVLAWSALILFFLPKLDRSSGESARARLVVILAAGLLLACWLFLSV